MRDWKLLEGGVLDTIQDDRVKNFVEHFALLRLGLDPLESNAINAEYDRKYDERISQDMKQDAMLFFEEILKKELSILSVIVSDFTPLNRRSMDHCGALFPEMEHIGFFRVPAPPPQI